MRRAVQVKTAVLLILDVVECAVFVDCQRPVRTRLLFDPANQFAALGFDPDPGPQTFVNAPGYELLTGDAPRELIAPTLDNHDDILA